MLRTQYVVTVRAEAGIRFILGYAHPETHKALGRYWGTCALKYNHRIVLPFRNRKVADQKISKIPTWFKVSWRDESISCTNGDTYAI